MLFHLADRLCKLETREALTSILEELQNLVPFTQKSEHLKQPFAYDFQDIFPAEKVTHHQRHKFLILIKGQCARLYQRLSRCQEIHLSHQQ